MTKNSFKLHNQFEPAGRLAKGHRSPREGEFRLINTKLWGGMVGKTFTMANVIANIGKPTLVIAHNKTLAAQLAQEYKEFFLKMQCTILCRTTIITSQKRTFP